MWRNYMEELGIQRVIDYLKAKGLPAGWPTETVDRERFGAVFEEKGDPHYRSQCPKYEGYWLLGGTGSVQCSASDELLPGIVWYEVCCKEYGHCPYFRKKNPNDKRRNNQCV